MSEMRKPEDRQDSLLEALLVETVRNRQSEGQSTQLRDLHGLLDVSQPHALQLARRLEDAGTLMVEADPLDALASAITVRPPVASYMRLFKGGK